MGLGLGRSAGSRGPGLPDPRVLGWSSGRRVISEARSHPILTPPRSRAISKSHPFAPPAMGDLRAWRAKLEHNALWVALGALAIAGVVVAAGIQVAPEVFYDHFWWEDIYGPLVVDARQCRTAASCPGLEGPAGIAVKDGYTVTSELTYGLVLAVLLYGIYVGLFRRFGIVADGWFVLGLLPWILLGPLARVLEDANVFCQAGTDCEPGMFAYLFISPVIYIHIAFYVIPALLFGVYVRERRDRAPWRLSAPVAGVLALEVALFALIGTRYVGHFSALPPLWLIALSAIAALALFHWRAKQGLASVNLTAFTLGVPFATGTLYLIARWLSGDVWSREAWNGLFFLDAGAFVLVMAALVAALVYAGSRALSRSALAPAWGRLAQRVPERTQNALGKYGGLALVAGLLLAGMLPALARLVQEVPAREVLIPVLMLGGFLALVVFAFLHVGREVSREPSVLLVFSAGINLALVFAHMVDGLATWVALEDPLGFGIPPYGEKHPFSEFLLRYWDGFLFPFTKLLMVLVVAWMLDRESRNMSPEASLDSRNMVGLVKMAIFVLGFAPGLRSLLRLTMGV